MIHVLAHALSGTVFGSPWFWPALALAGVLFALRTWLGGTTNTWEREWRGKRIIVVVSVAAAEGSLCRRA
jgi:hypothetical protein